MALSPKKLSEGAHIRVIAPSRSLAVLSEDIRNRADNRLRSLGFRVSFAKHAYECDDFLSSSIKSRIEDIHEAFADRDVNAVLTVIGGYNANQLLGHIDYKLIANNPKIICGYSDITVLLNAISASTDLVTYYGPHYSSWGMARGFEYSVDSFKRCCMNDEPYELSSSTTWSDDKWFMNQENRCFYEDEGPWVINSGYAKARIVGGYAHCMTALQGTPYWNSLHDSILMLEIDSEMNVRMLDRAIQSLIHQPDFIGVKGIILGRFPKSVGIDRSCINQVIRSKEELSDMPVIANFSIGHTTPIATIPVNGVIEMSVTDSVTIIIKEH